MPFILVNIPSCFLIFFSKAAEWIVKIEQRILFPGKPLVPAGSRTSDQTTGSEWDQWESSAADRRRNSEASRALHRL